MQYDDLIDELIKGFADPNGSLQAWKEYEHGRYDTWGFSKYHPLLLKANISWVRSNSSAETMIAWLNENKIPVKSVSYTHLTLPTKA